MRIPGSAGSPGAWTRLTRGALFPFCASVFSPLQPPGWKTWERGRCASHGSATAAKSRVVPLKGER